MDIVEQINKNFDVRNQRIFNAVRREPTRTIEKVVNERCHLCGRFGLLIVYRLRDGSELLAGGRCARYLDFVIQCRKSGRIPFLSYFKPVLDQVSRCARVAKAAGLETQ